MQIVFLGTGGSWPSKNRNVSAVAVRIGRDVLLFDCGEGTQRQLMGSNVSFMKINRILISHFHGDHFLGLPGLVQSMSLNNRKKTLEIYGPTGTVKLVNIIINLGYFIPTFHFIVKDLKDNDTVKCDGYIIKAKTAEHNVPTLAYAVEEDTRPGRFNVKKAKKLGIPEGPFFRKLQKGGNITVNGRRITSDMVLGKPRKGKKIVYISDTKPSGAIADFAKGSNVLIHDATADSSLEKKANKYGHSSARQAAMIAKKAGAKILFLTHISPRYEDAGVLEKDAKKVFPNSVVAEDFLEYDVK
ncbi:MAG: ribonuclease Z [Thermoplasmatales archaeon]|nr:ribonuclease Z [Thermoplasmatales archaeon]